MPATAASISNLASHYRARMETLVYLRGLLTEQHPELLKHIDEAIEIAGHTHQCFLHRDYSEAHQYQRLWLDWLRAHQSKLLAIQEQDPSLHELFSALGLDT